MEQTTGQRLRDICGWCGKNLPPQKDVGWRGLYTHEGVALAANYCRLTKTQRLDAKKGQQSLCYMAGHESDHNMRKVAARLRKYLKALQEDETLARREAS